MSAVSVQYGQWYRWWPEFNAHQSWLIQIIIGLQFSLYYYFFPSVVYLAFGFSTMSLCYYCDLSNFLTSILISPT